MASSYTVQSGDTASQIASNLGVNLGDISGYRSGDPNKIYPGEVLNVNSKTDASAAPASTPSTPVTSEGATYKSVVPTIPTTPANTVNASDLTAKPFTVSSADVPTAYQGLLGLTQATQANIDTLTPKVASGASDITSITDTLANEESKRTSLYSSEGVDAAKADLDSINQQMKARDLAYQRQVQTIQDNNPTGQLQAGQDSQLNLLARDHAREMADLAIVAEAKQGNYTTAKDIVDKKVDAETEGLKIRLSSLQNFYTDNKDNLSTQQKTLLQQQTDILTKVISDKQDSLKQVGELQITAAKNGAPASVIQSIGKSQSVTDAVTAGGSYLGDILSVSEAKTLGVPYGTTRAAAEGKSAVVPVKAATTAKPTSSQVNVSQAGLSKAGTAAQTYFLSTPAAFQDEWKRNVALDSSKNYNYVYTLDELHTAYTKWYDAQQTAKKSSTSSRSVR